MPGWTIDTLMEHFEKLMEERDLRYQQRWHAQETASLYALEKTNEFRGALEDLSTKQATKIELSSSIKTLSDKIDINSREVSDLRSRLDVGNPIINSIQNELAAEAGQHKGTDVTMAKVATAITLGIGVMTLVLTLVIFIATRTGF